MGIMCDDWHWTGIYIKIKNKLYWCFSIFPLIKVSFLSSLAPAYFTELHSHSERSLQDALSPLGPLYSQNTRLFGGLYTDLRQYYRGSALNLDETLSEFWSRLLERTFKFSASTDVSQTNMFNLI